MLYDLDFSEVIAAVRSLSGIAVLRPDLAESFGKLLSTGSAFVADLDQAATKATGNRVIRYHPSERFKMIMAAFARDRQLGDFGIIDGHRDASRISP